VLRSEVRSDSGPSRARPAELDRDSERSNWQRPRGKCEEFRSHLPRGIRSSSAGKRRLKRGPAPKPRSLACFERRKPPLGAVFWVFDLRRASLGVGQGRNKVAPTAVRVGAPGRARALSSLNT
jgi:hypothetical protein